MRKLTWFIALLGFVLIVSNPDLISGAKKAQVSSQSSSEGAEAYFSETTWDFGKIPINSTVTHVFWLKNVGTDSLRILKVRPG